METLVQEEDNATWLFIKPSRHFHSAEAWWTSLFTIFSFYMSREGKNLSMSTYRVSESNQLVSDSKIDLCSMQYENTVVDAVLRKETFGLTEWPNEFGQISPDITIVGLGDQKSVVFIEVKTVGESVKRNLKLYHELRDYLRSIGWKSDLYYLMSEGHEIPSDWQKLRDADARILKWEDMFRLAAGTPFDGLLGRSLQQYVR
jgi:hypothetical protein